MQVKAQYGKRLVILVTELDTGRERQLTPETDPDLPVRVAVRMSMGVPGLMEPFRYERFVLLYYSYILAPPRPHPPYRTRCPHHPRRIPARCNGAYPLQVALVAPRLARSTLHSRAPRQASLHDHMTI